MFNAEKYSALLEGLEITIYSKKAIFLDNEEFRIDSEYYKNEYLELYKTITNAPILRDIVTMTDLTTNGSFETVSKILNDGKPKIVPYIRSGDAGDTFIDFDFLDKISMEAHLKLSKSTTKLHDIVLPRKGKVRWAALH